MSHVSYQISGGMASADVRKIHDQALGLIERVGLRVPHEATLRLISDCAGVSVAGDRVRFRPERVQAALAAQSYPSHAELTDREFSIITGAYELNVIDMETNAVRPATYQDLVDLTKLAHSFGMHGSAPVKPMDLPPLLQELAHYKVSWEYSDRRPGAIFDANPVSSSRAADYIYEMAQAARKPFAIGLWIISPFTVTTENIELLYHFRGRKTPFWVATMPVAGTTAPIFMPAAYVQSTAELLAGLTLIHLMSDGVPIYCSVIDSIRAYPFDMKYASFVYGSPEDLLATLIQIQLNQFYGIPIVAKSLLTSAKWPDAHAAAEKSAHTLAAALMGARIFINAGLLSVDEIYSAEQVVIDYEIVQHVKRVCEGFDITDETLAAGVIEEVALGAGNYLAHPTTLEHFRKATRDPSLFTHSTMRQWLDKGMPDVIGQARKIAKKRIAQHDYLLDAETRRELDGIYARAAREAEQDRGIRRGIA
jgi:trimethylamine--corrinoid protein Co-methyltransferase